MVYAVTGFRFSTLLASLASLAFSSCYYITQGNYLLSYTVKAKSISAILENPQTDEKTRGFLQTVREITAFAQGSGLAAPKNYQTYYELDRDYLVAVVQAAPPLSLTPHTWNYPFMGSLPYRGFYNTADARAEAASLKTKNYDVLIRPVRAFSTIGILRDPVYSFMQSYSEAELAEMLLHEQTHATIWIRKGGDFNEQLASFVGRTLALRYIAQKYGETSEQYGRLFRAEENRRAFTQFLYEVRGRLQTLYNNVALSDKEKLEEKQRVLREAAAEFRASYEARFTDDSYKSADISSYNNAVFSLVSLYENNSGRFAEAYQRCGSNMPVFIASLKKALRAVPKKKLAADPYALLDAVCRAE